jgi:hypothetical protein
LCLREPIPEIAQAAHDLDEAVSAHLAGRRDDAAALIRRADLPAIRDWTESIWGKQSPYVQYRPVPNAPVWLPREERIPRMPSTVEKLSLLKRDGYHCRFCGIPVIRQKVRIYLKKIYPDALPWGRTNSGQHAAFQAMWAQYDHLQPYARGGLNDPSNMVITCAPCNFGRMSHTLEEVGLLDPRTREPIHSSWDGLDRVFGVSPRA